MRSTQDAPGVRIIRQVEAAMRRRRAVRVLTSRGAYVGVIREFSGSASHSAVHIERGDHEEDLVVALGDVQAVTEIDPVSVVCVACGSEVLGVRFPASIEAVVEAGEVTGIVVMGPGTVEPLGVTCLDCGEAQPRDHPAVALYGSECIGWRSSIAMGRSLARLLGMTPAEGERRTGVASAGEVATFPRNAGSCGDGWNGR